MSKAFDDKQSYLIDCISLEKRIYRQTYQRIDEYRHLNCNMTLPPQKDIRYDTTSLVLKLMCTYINYRFTTLRSSLILSLSMHPSLWINVMLKDLL